MNLLNAVSRKVHGSTGTFDVPLPLYGKPGIECRFYNATFTLDTVVAVRQAGGPYQIVATFDAPVTFVSATMTRGAGQIASTSTSGAQVFINLVNVTSGQTIEVTLASVSDGEALAWVTIQMSVLLGDFNADGVVDQTDLHAVAALSSGHAAVTGSNFRYDVKTDGGTINSSDVQLAKKVKPVNKYDNRIPPRDSSGLVGLPAAPHTFIRRMVRGAPVLLCVSSTNTGLPFFSSRVAG